MIIFTIIFLIVLMLLSPFLSGIFVVIGCLYVIGSSYYVFKYDEYKVGDKVQLKQDGPVFVIRQIFKDATGRIKKIKIASAVYTIEEFNTIYKKIKE